MPICKSSIALGQLKYVAAWLRAYFHYGCALRCVPLCGER